MDFVDFCFEDACINEDDVYSAYESSDDDSRDGNAVITLAYYFNGYFPLDKCVLRPFEENTFQYQEFNTHQDS